MNITRPLLSILNVPRNGVKKLLEHYSIILHDRGNHELQTHRLRRATTCRLEACFHSQKWYATGCNGCQPWREGLEKHDRKGSPSGDEWQRTHGRAALRSLHIRSVPAEESLRHRPQCT